MILKIVNTKEDRDKVKYIIETYHSYVPTYKSVGRRIDWLIFDNNDFTLLGMIGIGSSVYPPPKDLLNYLQMNKNQYKEIFNSLANNWRFCLIKDNITDKNAGTKILKEFRREAKIEWQDKYDNELKYIVTFVGAGHNGAVYKADNWSLIGKTSGLPPHKSVSMKWDSKEQLKEKFVKPTGENAKLIFIKELK